jgi:hypothetical protein
MKMHCEKKDMTETETHNTSIENIEYAIFSHSFADSIVFTSRSDQAPCNRNSFILDCRIFLIGFEKYIKHMFKKI